MKDHLESYRDPALARKLLREIADVASRISAERISLMEVCGTHTMAIARYGIRSLLPEKLKLLSGPGCPVCVTPAGYVDAAVELSGMPEVTVVTFGDLMRVPGSESSLAAASAAGADVRVGYSPAYALQVAEREPERKVVFLAIGFETTSPSIAWVVLEGKRKGLGNLSFLVASKLIPPALEALAGSEDVRIDGFICPGHVSAIIGSRPYESVAHSHGIPCVVSGFEPVDVLVSVLMLCGQIERGEAKVEIEYTRTVPAEGNPKALGLMNEVFRAATTEWRGLGAIPESGLELKAELQGFDSRSAFGMEVASGRDNPACRCGDVLRGRILPPECSLFGKRCSPLSPVGACMVSSEGACAAFYKYSKLEEGSKHGD